MPSEVEIIAWIRRKVEGGLHLSDNDPKWPNMLAKKPKFDKSFATNRQVLQSFIEGTCEPIFLGKLGGIIFSIEEPKFGNEENTDPVLTLSANVFPSFMFDDRSIQSHFRYAEQQLELEKQANRKSTTRDEDLAEIQEKIHSDVMNELSIQDTLWYDLPNLRGFFLVNSSGVQDPLSNLMTFEELKKNLQYGSVVGHGLFVLKWMMECVFLPMLNQRLDHIRSEDMKFADQKNLIPKQNGKIYVADSSESALHIIERNVNKNEARTDDVGKFQALLKEKVDMTSFFQKFVSNLTNVVTQLKSEVHIPTGSCEYTWEELKSSKIEEISKAHYDEYANYVTNILSVLNSVMKENDEKLKANQVSAVEVPKLRRQRRKSLRPIHQKMKRGTPRSKIAHLGKGPIREVNFWLERNAILGSLYDQVKNQPFKKLLFVLQSTNSELPASFDNTILTLLNMSTEAQDNAKLLYTLERHFKLLESSFISSDLKSVKDSIPSMVNSLRMVWIISRHYNRDDRMLNFLLMIVQELSDIVAQHVRPEIVFAPASTMLCSEIGLHPPEDIKDHTEKTVFFVAPELIIDRIANSIEIMNSWRTSYFSNREKIEQSGTELRWEFERKKLFSQTDYIASVCGDLLEICNTLSQVHRFLENQPQQLTGSATTESGIAKKLARIQAPLCELPFNIFDQRYKTSWIQVFASFKSKINEIETETTEVIDCSFRKLRSSETAFDLLESLNNSDNATSLQTGSGIIESEMLDKYNECLKQFRSEIEQINNEYEAGLDNVKVYGHFTSRLSISELKYCWTNQPFILQNHQNSEITHYTKEKFGFEIEKESRKKEISVDSFHYSKFLPATMYKTPVAGTIMWAQALYFRLKKVVLKLYKSKMNLFESEAGKLAKEDYINFAMKVDTLIKEVHERWCSTVKQTVSESLSRSLFRRDGEKIVSNLSKELILLMDETNNLQSMGFPVPEEARNISLQIDLLLSYHNKLSSLLSQYYQILDVLSPSQRGLLEEKIKKFEIVLRPGFFPLNWSSLSVLDFASTVTKELDEFESIVNRVLKKTAAVELIVSKVANTDLIKDLTSKLGGKGFVTIEQFCDICIQHVKEIQLNLKQEYLKLIPKIMKIEEIVCDTNSGRAPTLFGYYKSIQAKIFHSLLQMTFTSLGTLHEALQKQLFNQIEIHAEVNGPDSILRRPNANEIHASFSKLIYSITFTAKFFKRWERDSCVLCKAVSITSKNSNDVPSLESQMSSFQHGQTDSRMYSSRSSRMVNRTGTANISFAHGKPQNSNYHIFTFYDDIKRDTCILHRLFKLHATIQRNSQKATQYINSWKVFQTKHRLWNTKMFNEIKCSSPNIPEFIQKLQLYEEIAISLDRKPDRIPVGIFSVNLIKIKNQIKERAIRWMHEYGKILCSTAQSIYSNLVNRHTQLKTDLLLSNTEQQDNELSFEKFETVYLAINDTQDQQSDTEYQLEMLKKLTISIQDISLIQEMKNQEPQETELLFASLEQRKESMSKVEELVSKFSELLLHSKQRNQSLCFVKEDLKRLLGEEIVKYRGFLTNLGNFYDRLYTTDPVLLRKENFPTVENSKYSEKPEIPYTVFDPTSIIETNQDLVRFTKCCKSFYSEDIQKYERANQLLNLKKEQEIEIYYAIHAQIHEISSLYEKFSEFEELFEQVSVEYIFKMEIPKAKQRISSIKDFFAEKVASYNIMYQESVSKLSKYDQTKDMQGCFEYMKGILTYFESQVSALDLISTCLASKLRKRHWLKILNCGMKNEPERKTKEHIEDSDEEEDGEDHFGLSSDRKEISARRKWFLKTKDLLTSEVESLNETDFFSFLQQRVQLGNLLSINLSSPESIEQVKKETTYAIQESKIEAVLVEIDHVWKSQSFEINKSLGNTIMNEEIIEEILEDNITNLQTLLNSRYVAIFRDKIEQWHTSLYTVSETISLWTAVQQKWLYLSGIFKQEDLRLQLKSASESFDKVDTLLQEFLNENAQNPNILHRCGKSQTLEKLKEYKFHLEICKKSLSDYLDQKRQQFPRFFFLSDDELLSILGNSLGIRPHLLKLFMNCKDLLFSSDYKTITGMISSEGEKLQFSNPVQRESQDDGVEKWMKRTEKAMTTTLHQLVKQCVFAKAKIYSEQDKIDWIDTNLGMAGIVASQIWWTWLVEYAFKELSEGKMDKMDALTKKLTSQLNQLVSQIRRTDLPKLLRKKLNSMIIIDVHARDVVESFVLESVVTSDSFEWESQLRFYWEREDDDILIKQCTGSFRYGYEYQGVNGRLVITPLTDRCVMTLTQALTFGMGGSPAGPAGTGKTETVKDLAKTLAIPCFVTNCGEGLDYKAMGSIFSGLVQTGSWGCFDEFNRIELEVLSVVSTQLRHILAAIRQKLSFFDFNGKKCICSHRTGFFITMNPGYAGRTTLPDNLKSLFRPVVMVVPDMYQICQIMLFSEGFEDAAHLATKMTSLYKLASEFLSKQHHYDFGLRALKSVLILAGSLKRDTLDRTEEEVLMRALRDMNLPKFIHEDSILFLELIDDLFPGLDCPRTVSESLKQAVLDTMIDSSLVPLQGFVDKVIQLDETMSTRHTCMIVGPTCGGKTTILDLLAKSIKISKKKKVKTFRINPKAQTVAELYGNLDQTSRDWVYGLLSYHFKRLNQPLKNGEQEERWLIFDGDVDALWIENMNSVMDDNKLLTLANGERLFLAPHLKLLIEVSDLQYASPATISRCGMVYVDPKNLGYAPFYQKWISTRLESGVLSSLLRDLLQNDGDIDPQELLIKEELHSIDEFLKKMEKKYIKPLVSSIFTLKTEKLSFALPTNELSVIKQLTVIFDAVTAQIISGIQQQAESIKAAKKDLIAERQKALKTMYVKHLEKLWDEPTLEGIFQFSLMWSFGSFLSKKSCITRFEALITKFSEMETVSYDIKAKIRPIPKNQLPDVDIASFFFDGFNGEWVHWKSVLESSKSSPSGSTLFVQTPEILGFHKFLDFHDQMGIPALLVGDAGTGKTICVESFLHDKPQLKINFSSRTSSFNVQQMIEACIEKRGSQHFPTTKHPSGKLYVFTDDINMPDIDIYGTQQPVAFFKLLVEFNSMFSRDPETDFEEIKLSPQSFQHFSTMGSPSSGRNNLDARFLSKFSIKNIPLPSSSSAQLIFRTILSTHFSETKGFSPEIIFASHGIPSVIMKIFMEISTKLAPTPAKFHYVFNLRDVFSIVQGILQAAPDDFACEKDLLDLVHYESEMRFKFRLIHKDENKLVDEVIANSMTEAYPKYVPAESRAFGDFHNIKDEDLVKKSLRPLKKFENLQAVRTILSQNASSMGLIMFDTAIDHVLRICRILHSSTGHALLMGGGGSGKRSLARLACSVYEYRRFEITIFKGYDEKCFIQDLKRFMIIAGTGIDVSSEASEEQQQVTAKGTVLILSEANILSDSFLEHINNLLVTGNVGDSYFTDEDRAIISGAEFPNKPQDVPALDYFLQISKQNMKIILCLSPGEVLRRRCRAFPGLTSCTTIDFFFPWPERAMSVVASELLKEKDETLTDIFVKIHAEVLKQSKAFIAIQKRVNHVTPKHFLVFIESFNELMSRFSTKSTLDYDRLGAGLTKLSEAGTEVAALQTQLNEQNIVVNDKTKECEEIISRIEIQSKEVNRKRDEAVKKQEELKIESKKIKEEKILAEQALEQALPALEAAKEALKDLKKEDIQEIKILSNPPLPVKVTCLCVLELKPSGKENPSEGWSGAKTMMGNMQFLNNLKNYPRDDITPKMYHAVQKLLNPKKGDKLTLETMARISKAGAGLLAWVKSMVLYYDVARDVKPRRLKVQQMEKAMMKSRQGLKKLQKDLTTLSEEMKKLQSQYKEKNNELVQLKTQAKQMQEYLDAASKLISGLSSEQKRWFKQREIINEEKQYLQGKSVLSAAFFAYLSIFDATFRKTLLYTKFVDIIKQSGSKTVILPPDELSVEKILTTDVEISSWVGEGLPADEFSIQNAILTTQSIYPFPILIDPQLQATSWISNRESQDKVLTIKQMTDVDFPKALELCIRFGNPLIFDNISEELYLDPLLDSILSMKKGDKTVVLGDKTLEVDPEFSMYFISKVSNPKFSAETASKTLIINYSVTMRGLEDQLLEVVVGFEKPELATQRTALIQTISANTVLLDTLENTLLQELSNAHGNILENHKLIETLNSAKVQAISISEQIVQSKNTQEELNNAANKYRRAAIKGSSLFFSLNSLSMLNRMYQFSLDEFLCLFNQALRESLAKAKGRRDVVQLRLSQIIALLVELTYNYGCLGLFQDDRIAFATQIAIMSGIRDEELTKSQLSYLLKGENHDIGEHNDAPKSISQQQWSNLKYLESIIPDTKIINFLKTTELLSEWIESKKPETHSEFYKNSDITPFEQLSIAQTLRPDRFLATTRATFIPETLRSPSILSFDTIFKDYCSPTRPLVFILSPGADPIPIIQSAAQKRGIVQANKLRSIALGQGQGKSAVSLIETGRNRGYWIVLQNCHLMPKWLDKLQDLVLDKEKKRHPEFRLFLTTAPTDAFPVGILHQSIKYVSEPPDGLKAKMKSSLEMIQSEIQLDSTVLDSATSSKLFPLTFVLSYFHAVIQERRKYGKLGWNVIYEFNDADFMVSYKLLRMYLERSPEGKIPWSSLTYLIGGAMYGGRVTDSYDRRVLMCYLNEYMGEFLFEDFKQFYFSRVGHDYLIPKTEDNEFLKKYLADVDKYPEPYSCEILGLSMNSAISFSANASKSLRSKIRLLNSSYLNVASSVENAEDSTENALLALLRKIQGVIPEEFELEDIKRTFQVNNACNPLSTVLFQEIERWNILVSVMKSSGIALQRAIIGEIRMSEELEVLASEMNNSQMPASWQKFAPETTMNLLAWIGHFERRHDQYQRWIHDMKHPKVVWLSGLHRPESFLTALIQTSCRKHSWALDTSALHTTVTHTEYEPADTQNRYKNLSRLEDGCYIDGLILEEAGWDRKLGELAKQKEKELTTVLPVLKITPVPISRLSVLNSNTFKTPVYVTNRRRNAMGQGLVFDIHLRSHKHESHWILQGTAAVLNEETILN